ncbi:probable acyl-[acyl-carrier-protein]--UDP-N-acetylglucosamine O-acyltransferase, mitochondrial isoform X3 [Diospyros lotus]|uniref:probable acyl-[acyl-carrier-protein]--UDP-N-acetylglucosamine O-acyltransferase, mitochondrial isoform X3 n=1 Tax=Diospyros lotus TaxID=55363 RepID=UPI002256BC38|nr:probable acyl-[acyl-carrier-protein]--UDP-N-acetylglucosamine O-acyltransferase, mitochondrial isoform X3 [Diospyros lotus]
MSSPASSLLRVRRQLLSSAFSALSLRRFSTSSLLDVSGESKENATLGQRPSFIHPTAVVHPDAVLGQGVSIGPFCTVGSSVKLGNACQLYPGSHIFGNTEIGDQCVLMTGAVVGDDIPGRTVIGRNNFIGHHSVVGIKCQDMKYRDYAHTAGAIVVHQFCRISSFSFIGGGSVVSQDVPRYMMVSGERAELRGLNLEGLRRRGFSDTEIRSLRTAYRKIFMPTDASGGGIEKRLAELVFHDCLFCCTFNPICTLIDISTLKELHEELACVPAVLQMVVSIRNSFAEDRRGICKFRSWSDS